MSINSWVGVGNLTSDPVAKMTQNGNKMCTFRIAVNSGWGDNKQTSFLHIVTFNKTAENCEKYLAKGRKAAVRGRIVTGSYEKSDGTKVYTTDIYADEVEFLSGGEGNGAPKQEQPSAPSGIPEGFLQDEEDSLPF